MTSFFGKYRGTVYGNVDPEGLGRLQVSVPSVLGDWTWAWPCVPYAGPGVGFFAIPPKDAHVWVEFEAGETSEGHAIWSGCYWERNQVPADPAVADMKVFKTGSVSITLNDGQRGGLTIEVKPPAVTSPLKIVLDSDGIALENGKSKIKLTTTGVSVNDGALEVT